MSKTLTILLIILAFVLGGGGVYSYFQFFAPAPETTETETTPKTEKTTTPETTPESSSEATATTPSETTTTTEKTVKDVHCLQSPKKGTNIKVTSPSDYSTNPGSKLTFSGTANVFENQFRYRLKDCRGPILSQGTVEAQGEAYANPPFAKTITFTLSRSPMDAILEVYDLSAADGSEIDLTQVPVRLTK